MLTEAEILAIKHSWDGFLSYRYWSSGEHKTPEMIVCEKRGIKFYYNPVTDRYHISVYDFQAVPDAISEWLGYDNSEHYFHAVRVDTDNVKKLLLEKLNQYTVNRLYFLEDEHE